MTQIQPIGATIPGVTHHRLDSDGVSLHYVAAGTSGSPIVLLHGWPETWWAFHSLIPLLAKTHRVYALDLRGFGDSGADGDDFTDEASVAAMVRTVLDETGRIDFVVNTAGVLPRGDLAPALALAVRGG